MQARQGGGYIAKGSPCDYFDEILRNFCRVTDTSLRWRSFSDTCIVSTSCDVSCKHNLRLCARALPLLEGGKLLCDKAWHCFWRDRSTVACGHPRPKTAWASSGLTSGQYVARLCNASTTQLYMLSATCRHTLSHLLVSEASWHLKQHQAAECGSSLEPACGQWSACHWLSLSYLAC